jgi:excisionase family DNA binding protein
MVVRVKQQQPESLAAGDARAADGFATIAEAAEFLRLSRATVYNLMEAGQLAYAKFGRSRRVPRRALLEYAERCIVARQRRLPCGKESRPGPGRPA